MTAEDLKQKLKQSQVFVVQGGEVGQGKAVVDLGEIDADAQMGF